MSISTTTEPTLWQSEDNFFDAAEYYDSLIKDIEQANSEIYIESYIFETDHLGLRVLKALTNARKRGVDIKVLVDGVGSMNTMDELLSEAKASDIPIKVYHPLPWNFKSYRYAVTKGSFFHKLLHFTGRINHRDHRKLCVIDCHIAWTGSFNLCRSHLPLSEQGHGWKDHGLRVTGANTQTLAEEFLQLWNSKAYKRLKRPFPNILSTLNPRRRRRKIRRIVKSIDQARKRIWIANAYFAPHRNIVSALNHAKARGVDVRILTGGKSDIFFFPFLTRSFYADLLRYKVSIFEWQDSVLHSKIVLIDDYCFSGSTNLNTRSHLHDLEIDIMVCQTKTIKEITKQMLDDFDRSQEITTVYIAKNRLYIAFMGLIPKLLRYWL